MKKGNKYFLFRLTLTAVLIAMSIVVRMIGSVMLPLFGSNTVRLTFEGIFTALPGLLFGPIFGGVAYGVCDVLGLIVNPSGPWIPLITLANVALGVIQALTFKALKKIPERKGYLFLKLLISLIIGGIIISVANSFIIFYVYSPAKGLIALIVARLIEEIASCILYAAAITILYFVPKIEYQTLQCWEICGLFQEMPKSLLTQD